MISFSFNRFKPFWKKATAPQAHERQAAMESWNNFTPRALEALALARREANRFHHNFVGTEHLLLGLIALGRGTAVAVLRKMGLHLDAVRAEVEKQVGTGPDQKIIGNIPYTPRVKKVLALAAKEARSLNHRYIGTEHLLLGLLREGDGVAGRVLKSLGVDLETTRQEILKELDPNFRPTPKDTAMPQNPESPKPQSDAIDINQRYDVYCTEQSREVVYRNALFKGAKKLFPKSQSDFSSDVSEFEQLDAQTIFIAREHEVLSEFIELEQADGQTIFIARHSITKFCEHGRTPG